MPAPPREELVELVRRLAWERREEPFTLTSGEVSHDYVDAKRAVARGAHLRLVAEAVVAAVPEDFDAAGGLTMGADPLAHAVAMVRDCGWFAVRKEPKKHGRQRFIEGHQIGPESRVLLLDDVVTTGGSVVRALEKVRAEGATVVAAVTLVDRGERAAEFFAGEQIPYRPLVTYRDLGIPPVGG